MKPGGERGALRILVISNLYPPLYIGGYELVCRDIVEELKSRGHAMTVLTSQYGLTRPRVDGYVHRWLAFRPDPAPASILQWLRTAWRDQACLRRVLAATSPDVILVFNLYRVSHALLLTAQHAGRPVVYAFSAEWLEPEHRADPWLHLWSRDATTPIRRGAKRLVRGLLAPLVPAGREPLDLRHAYFTSARLKERFLAKGFAVRGAEVIHWGVDVERFRPDAGPAHPPAPRLLFAGRIAKEKGLHTVVEALHLLSQADALRSVILDVAGPVQDPGYLALLREQIGRTGLETHVRFLGPIPREAMPDLYRDHDIFLFPSIWEEPFSLALLEAMACGLAVVGTVTGGSREVLEDGINALTVPPEDPVRLAGHVGRLLREPALRERIGAAAVRRVRERFDLKRMMDRTEEFLRRVADGAGE